MEERRPDLKGSRVCIEYIVADSRQGVVLQFWRLCEVLATPHPNNLQCSVKFNISTDLDFSLGTMQALEKEIRDLARRM